jgi:hypothetical protein
VSDGRQPQQSNDALPAEGASPSAEAPAAANDSGFRAETPPRTSGVFSEVAGVLDSARESLSNFFELMSLEARRAGLALFWMVAWAVVAAVCIITTWLGLMAALAMWAVSLGLLPVVAIILVAIFNLVAGVVLIRVCVGLSRDLLFPATRRQLARNPSAKVSAS